MKFDFSETTAALQKMVSGFLDRLPAIMLALIVFAIFFVLGKVVRGLIRKFAESNKQHYNLGLVLGRLAQGVIFFLGLLIALVIAIPSFEAGQLVSVLGLSSVAFGFLFAIFYKTFWPVF